MRWRQFFTPVESMNTDQARRYIADNPPENLTILDVRQPKEYQSGHIPGAVLIPLPELNERINEIDPQKPTVVYCAVGGRSRVAAQMLSGKGFEQIYNMSGGFKAWEGEAALGDQDQGLAVFTDLASLSESLIIAYSMEKGLRDFYLSMLERAKVEPVRVLFQRLADIEINHQQRIFAEYQRIENAKITLEAFETKVVPGIMEGGLTTEEYLGIYNPDLESSADVISMAMSIEAQALDLYHRAAQIAEDDQTVESLLKIAAEERIHLNELAKLMENL
jgi:rhodanese-related sulfurtransferase/rubrerythrin